MPDQTCKSDQGTGRRDVADQSRTGASSSLPCELRLVARPTVAHTGGYLPVFFLVNGSDSDSEGFGIPFARARGPILGLAAAYLYVLVRLSVLNPAGAGVPDAHRLFDRRICGFWVFTSGELSCHVRRGRVRSRVQTTGAEEGETGNDQ